jgi:indole-3-glycerol phosphate synthase
VSDISLSAAGLRTDRSVYPTEHLPNSYVSRRSTEAQALSAWIPPTGTLGELTRDARERANSLAGQKTGLSRAAAAANLQPSLATALRRGDVSIIAEVKRSSPSKGVIKAGIDVENQAQAYAAGGAAAISILTEPTRFGGSNEDLVLARARVELPLLRKDFHVDPLQILEAKALGASAALVIARAVNPERMSELLSAGRDVGLEILVEIRNEAELDLALTLGARLIGVNNRNLETLEIDPETSLRLLPLIPRDVVAIAESGIRAAMDVERLGAAGADAVLVGTALSASSNPEAAVRSLTGIARTEGARKS